MNDLNEVLIEGRLVRDPKAKKLESGALVCTFSVASNIRFVDKTSGNERKLTTYAFVEAWQNVADSCNKYLKKGDGVRILGQLRQSRWTAENNVHMEKTYILAEHVEFKPKSVQPAPEPVKATEEGPSEVEQGEIDELIKVEEPEISDNSEDGSED